MKLKALATSLRKLQMERAKTIITIHQLKATLQENKTPQGCTVDILLGIQQPIPGDIKETIQMYHCTHQSASLTPHESGYGTHGTSKSPNG